MSRKLTDLANRPLGVDVGAKVGLGNHRRRYVGQNLRRRDLSRRFVLMLLRRRTLNLLVGAGSRSGRGSRGSRRTSAGRFLVNGVGAGFIPGHAEAGLAVLTL